MSTVDYTKFNKDGTLPEKNLDKRWWLVEKADRAQAVASVVTMLVKYDESRQAQYQRSARLYGNVSLFGINGLQRGVVAPRNETSRISYNVIQSAGDTIVAKMVKNKPKPLFLTSGGNWKIQRKAKKLDKFVEGVFYENDAYQLGTTAMRDAFALGDGLVQVFELHDRVKFERVMPGELYTDWMESLNGNPRQKHRVKNIDRAVLLDLFGDDQKKRDLVANARDAFAEITGINANIADQVTVIESWHLPSGPEAGDGMHTINLPVADGTLFEEKWEEDFFPFAKLPWVPRLNGYWSQSGPEQLQNIQLEMNKILWVIQRSFHLAGSFKVLLENGSKIVKEHINNDIGTMIFYNGKAPEYVVPPIVPMEMYSHLRDLKNAAFEQVGVSELSAASQKPAGLNSGKALREFNDIESDRFMTVGQSFERFFLDLARLSVWCAKKIFERKETYAVKVPGKKFIQTIDWKDINLTEDEYVMKIFPVSSLPNDPAGRLQTVQEYVQAGFIDPITARKLLDFPDLEQVENLANAQEDWINQVLEKIVDEGKYVGPEPEMNLGLAKTLTLQYIADGHNNGLDDDRMGLLRDFNTALGVLMAKAAPPPLPGPGAGAPQASPMPAPQSDLIPNVPGAQPALTGAMA